MDMPTEQGLVLFPGPSFSYTAAVVHSPAAALQEKLPLP